ncbi:MAG TPA: hypothetical protein VNI79_07910 [Sphingomicrobium sp.]|nr:hypothetical protein [Sphingomicrobium sp.]
MVERSANAGHGIVEIDARCIAIGTPGWAAYLERERALDAWKEYFPDPVWLREELAAARQAEPDRLFKPWEDWGWFVERMLANRMLLESSINSESTIDAVLYSAELSSLVTEARIKFKWEKFALSGLSCSQGASQGGKLRGESDKILDRREPLIAAYRRKREAGWVHKTAKLYAINHADYGDQKPLGTKQATRILNALK